MKKLLCLFLSAALLCTSISITAHAGPRGVPPVYKAISQARYAGTWTMLLNECGYPDNDVRARFTALLDKTNFTQDEAAKILASYEGGVAGDGVFSPRKCTAKNLENIHNGIEKVLSEFIKEHAAP